MNLRKWCEQNNRYDLIEQWSSKNEKQMEDYAYGSHVKAIWELSYDDPNTEKHFDFEWKSEIRGRTGDKQLGCPYLSGKAVWVGYNDLKTWCEQNNRYDLIEQWSSKNEKPITFYSYGSGQKVWWQLAYDDPVTHRHFNFEWQMSIDVRTKRNYGCPFLIDAGSGRQVWKGFNDLETWCRDNNRYDLIEQWSSKNNLDMSHYLVTSQYKALWNTSYDVPSDYSIIALRGKHFDFEWYAHISSRTADNNDCPYISGRAVWVGYNDLKTWCEQNNRYDLIEQWSSKNEKSMEDYVFSSHDIVIWEMSYDDVVTGKHFNFEWKSEIRGRTGDKQLGCPYLSGKAVWVGYNDLKTWCEQNNRYDLIEQWSPKNIKSMEEYTYGSNDKVLWFLPYDDLETGRHFDFEWEQVIKHRTSSKHASCPYLSGRALWVGYNDLVSTYPDLVKEWHPSKNGNKQPCNYSHGSHEKVWWHKSYFDPVTHRMTYLEWEQRIKSRTLQNADCPLLSGSSMERFAYEYLLNHKIQFDKEYKVKELGNKRFDIFIPTMNKMIELDGIQHFTDSKEFFEKGDTPFEKRVKNDVLKNQYCKIHDIDLLRVPYVFGTQTDKFHQILTDFLFNNVIDKDIKDWYTQFDFSNYLKEGRNYGKTES